MAQNGYSVPYDLSQSLLDVPLGSPKTASGARNKRLYTLKNFAFIFLAAMLYCYLTMGTMLHDADFIYNLVWSVGYWWLVYLMFRPTKTREMGYNQIRAMFEYPEKRSLNTRGSSLASNVGHFYGYGLEKNKVNNHYVMVAKDGTIWFNDGTVGRIYEIVGSASRSLFASSIGSIVADTADFYRTFPSDMAGTIISRKAGARVNAQIQDCEGQIRNWYRDPHVVQMKDGSDPNSVKNNPIYHLLKEQKRVLEEYVGTDQFQTLRQWLVVSGTDEKNLDTCEERLAQHSSYDGYHFLQSYRRIQDRDEAIAVLHNLNCSASTYCDTDMVTMNKKILNKIKKS